MGKFLTLAVTCPDELPDDYLKLYRDALLEWNREALAETQVIFFPQGKIAIDVDPFEVVEIDYERVDGYPIWDVCKGLRAAWDRIEGTYISVDHPEFLHGPGRLARTIDWLKAARPYYGLGNLLRPGSAPAGRASEKFRDESIGPSTWIRSFLDAGDWDRGRDAFEYTAGIHWMYWAARPQAPGKNIWIEDAFYVDRDFLEAMNFLDHIAVDMPFQDIYDVMQVMARTLYQHALPFQCLRADHATNKIFHLHHARSWGSWTPAIRDWFFSDPEKWKGTAYLDAGLWDRLIAFKQSETNSAYKAINELRFGPDGSAIRFGLRLSHYLYDGGARRLRDFYKSRPDYAI